MANTQATGDLAVISEQAVRKIVSREFAFNAVRTAFEAVASDRAKVFDVVIGTGLNDGEAFAIKSGNDGDGKTVGFKCGTYWAGNNDKGLAAHGSTIVLLDPDTGFPMVLVNASYLNGYRTAAANAFAEGLITSADEICALGSVTLGKSPGRSSESEITVFDSSGIAIQDLMAAAAAYEVANKTNQVQYINY